MGLTHQAKIVSKCPRTPFQRAIQTVFQEDGGTKGRSGRESDCEQGDDGGVEETGRGDIGEQLQRER